MPKPRIRIVIGTFSPMIGGSETQALQHARELRSDGYDATVLTLRHQSDWERVDQIDGVDIRRIGSRLFAERQQRPDMLKKALYLSGVVALAARLVRDQRAYDVIALYGAFYWLNPFGVATAVASLVTRTRLVYLVRSEPMPADRVTWPRRLAHYLARLLSTSLFRATGATMVVLTSRMVRDVRERGYEAPLTVLVPNGVNTRHFQPSDRQLRELQTVVCSARLGRQKGIDVLLHAWQDVLRHMPCARLLLLGEGPDRRDLETLAAQLDIGAAVQFCGSVADVRPYLARAAIAVLPSRFEGMPNALLEAMASGLACVATRVSGSEDLVEDGVNGYLVEPEDGAGLADALVRLLRDPELTERFGAASRQRAEEGYDWHSVHARMKQLYAGLFGASAVVGVPNA